MQIAKPLMICPKCFTENEDSLSLFNEIIECSECGALSDRVEYIAMKSRTDFVRDPEFKHAYILEDGDDWFLKIKPHHFEGLYWRFIFGIFPGLASIYMLWIGNLWGVIPLFLGLMIVWEFSLRLVGNVNFMLVGDRLTYFKGIGRVGFRGDIKWSSVSDVRYRKEEAGFHFYMPAGDPSNKGYKMVYFDLSCEQFSYIENFLYDKIDQRDKKSATIKMSDANRSHGLHDAELENRQSNTKTIYSESKSLINVRMFVSVLVVVGVLSFSVSFLMAEELIVNLAIIPFLVGPIMLLGGTIPAFINHQKHGQAVFEMDILKPRLGGSIAGVIHGFSGVSKATRMMTSLELSRVVENKNDSDFMDYIKIFSVDSSAFCIRDGGELEARLPIQISIPKDVKPSQTYDGEVGYVWTLIIEPAKSFPLTKYKITFPIEIDE